jgi:ketosteroid isomerase-like protein
MTVRRAAREAVGREDGIRALYGRYAHALRTDDTAALVDCFLSDGGLTLEGVGSFAGPAEIGGLFEKMATDRPRHHMTDLWIASLVGDEARCLAHMVLLDRGTGATVAYGHYEDVVVWCPDRAWRWRERTITIDWAGAAYRVARAAS